MGMGYGMGESLKELAEKRLARLAERYGAPEPEAEPEPVAVEAAQEKKKPGRPKSKAP